jgi:hypothetical protein
MAFVVLGAVDQMHNVVDLAIAKRFWQLPSGSLRSVSGSFSNRLARALRSRWIDSKPSVLALVRLEYWISFWRVATSVMVRGSSPRAFQRSTWNAKPAFPFNSKVKDVGAPG